MPSDNYDSEHPRHEYLDPLHTVRLPPPADAYARRPLQESTNMLRTPQSIVRPGTSLEKRDMPPAKRPRSQPVVASSGDPHVRRNPRGRPRRVADSPVVEHTLIPTFVPPAYGSFAPPSPARDQVVPEITYSHYEPAPQSLHMPPIGAMGTGASGRVTYERPREHAFIHEMMPAVPQASTIPLPRPRPAPHSVPHVHAQPTFVRQPPQARYTMSEYRTASTAAQPAPPPREVGTAGGSAAVARAPHSSSRPAAEALDNLIDDGKKPSFSYAMLIGMAIVRSPRRRLTLSQIYEWITNTFTYYRDTGPAWHNSIRHNLSLNKAFVKRVRPKGDPGKGNYWEIAEGQEEQFLRPKAQKKPEPLPERVCCASAVCHHRAGSAPMIPYAVPYAQPPRDEIPSDGTEPDLQMEAELAASASSSLHVSPTLAPQPVLPPVPVSELRYPKMHSMSSRTVSAHRATSSESSLPRRVHTRHLSLTERRAASSGSVRSGSPHARVAPAPVLRAAHESSGEHASLASTRAPAPHIHVQSPGPTTPQKSKSRRVHSPHASPRPQSTPPGPVSAPYLSLESIPTLGVQTPPAPALPRAGRINSDGPPLPSGLRAPFQPSEESPRKLFMTPVRQPFDTPIRDLANVFSPYKQGPPPSFGSPQ